MEEVRVFNNELSSLYEVKPPISKAKMTQITKSAIKGIKFYKHIVQSVEKFIQKCRPEYKVPGLYVVDSIVRQSRHQFGADKDVFGPRFVKNIAVTFQHLFKCAEDERPKIIRVLNLWQKNNVFPIDVIQPLLDMGHPNTSTETYSASEEVPNSRHKSNDSNWKGWPQGNDENVQENRTYAEITTTNLEKFTKAEMCNAMDEDVSRSSNSRNQKPEKPPEETVKFNEKLLDFDYGDEEDEEEVKNDDNHLSNPPNALALSVAQNLLSNPELIKQLPQMLQTIQQNEALKSGIDMQSQQVPKLEENETSFSSDVNQSPQQHILPPISYSDATNMMYQYDKNNIPFPPPQPGMTLMDPMSMDVSFPQVVPPDQQLLQSGHVDEDERVMYSMPGEPPLPPQDFDERTLMMPMDDRSRKERSRSRSGSRSRGRSNKRRSDSHSPKRKRSRSRSRAHKRSRSREKERIREKERERDREHERRRKGLPPIKKGFVSVCSTTIWLGHVPKSCSPMDISNAFAPYGTVLSIDMIPPRGCAYVVMEKRQDGYRALQKAKKFKLQGNNIKMAWAPGKGVKGKEYKDYWEVELGVSYVPFEHVPQDADALDLLEEGGFIDEDSLPDHLRILRKLPEDEKQSYIQNKLKFEASTTYSDPTAPNMVPPPIIPPTSVGLPMVMPIMQPQFGLHLPGLLPPQAMVMHPMGIPPPNPMLMVQQQSQNLLNHQTLQMVGGVPQMVPRTVPPVPSTLQNMKNVSSAETIMGSPRVPLTTSAGDATPTEEDGTSVSTPSTVQMATSSTPSTLSAISTRSNVSLGQFNPSLGIHNVNRTMLSAPPPVSSAGTPIPYPPPNVNFNFPPPGVRPPNQTHIPSNPQFPWMQKPSSSPYGDTESSQSANSKTVPVQPGVPMHMFGNRPPFHDPLSIPNHPNSVKDRDGGINRNLGDTDSSGNRNLSPHADKNVQEMVISTDDESSMDRDYPRNDIPDGPGQRFIIPPEFPRLPMNMTRMRGPPGPMAGPRFIHGMPMGSPFPMRMGGPRVAGGHGGHPRMEFPMHPSPRGLRMSGGPHGPHRNENILPAHEGREWYPRDYEVPSFERERDRRYHGDWSRESWVTAEDVEAAETQRMSRDHEGNRREDHEGNRREDREGNRREDREGNRREDREGNRREDREGNRREDRDGNRREDREGNRREDREGNRREDREGNRREDREVNRREDSEGNRREDSEGNRREDREKWNRDSSKSSETSRSSKELDQHDRFDKEDKKPAEKPKVSKSLMDDVFKLQFYQRDKKPNIAFLKKRLEASKTDKIKDEQPEKLENKEADNLGMENKESTSMTANSESAQIEHFAGSVKKEKDRESRKRSRWGRTLSEEREFQQQKRNEIEMKFQSYEQSHAAQQPLDVDPDSSVTDANTSDSKEINDPNENSITVADCDIVNAPSSQSNVLAVFPEIVAVTNIQNNGSGAPFCENVPSVVQTSPDDFMQCDDTVSIAQSHCPDTIVQLDKPIFTLHPDCSDAQILHDKPITPRQLDCSNMILQNPVAEVQCNDSVSAAQGENLLVGECDSVVTRFESNSQVAFQPKDVVTLVEPAVSLNNPNDNCYSDRIESFTSEPSMSENHLKNNDTEFSENIDDRNQDGCEDFKSSTETNESAENSNVNTSPFVSAES